MKPQYEPKTLTAKLGKLIEECGEVLAAAGKSMRFGFDGVNKELPPEDREVNVDWLLREIKDLELAISIVKPDLLVQSQDASLKKGVLGEVR